MNYLKLTIETKDSALSDILIAQLGKYEFNGFVEEEECLVAYISEADCSSELEADLMDLTAKYHLIIKRSILEDQNWNAKWESDYEPVLVDDFCAVRATFHAPITDVEHEIIVTPKMSFGTGHHATTYMMMKQMQGLSFEGQTVFDYGCGTGVLAILAQKLGAKESDGIDIDSWAYENTLENVEINNCADTITVYCGEIEAAPAKEYNVVLANINRNVILNTMDKMAARLKKGGYLLTSGFLEADIDLVLKAAEKHGLKLVKKMEREQWRCLMLS
ncbi:MAG: Ribosomal protein L11 methyltransferase (EC [uncultured Aureispira sp.]|uniref:Ribosomal protein L11 methyltransferase n=1 Tax=uncultured Aureispira sp. TaxID=1331704 RepID=A0A6S6TM39_9BACT|nr:MAG: Ribosomal protein L11 methyltransferase (EC [uncultured Aureispira sp.]